MNNNITLSANGIIIPQPPNQKVVIPDGKAELKFNSRFSQKWTSRYRKAQMFIDSEVLRLCEPFIPMLTGTLIRSGILGTEIGSGTVKWITPYAKSQYYGGRKPGTSNFGPLRGRYWFHRMKAVHVKQILAGAKKIAGGK